MFNFKTLEKINLEKMNLVELNAQEVQEVEGGIAPAVYSIIVLLVWQSAR